jgi:hypothetical protein
VLVPRAPALSRALAATGSNLQEIAAAVDINNNTLTRATAGTGYPQSNIETLEKLIEFCEQRGIRFTSDVEFVVKVAV